MSFWRFKDRTHAGQYLARDPKIKALADQNPIVLALPRGGVPVAFEYLRCLKLELQNLSMHR